MDEIDRLTPDQLNRLAAKAQWKLKKREFGDHYDTVDAVDYWIEKKKIWLSEYDPCHNGQQAMDLQKRFHVDVTYTYSIDEVHEELDESEWVEAVVYLQSCDSPSIRSSTPERAITLAVIASKWGTEIDEELLNEHYK